MHPLERPWYRQPMLWLVIAIPALTVPAGLATVAVAFRGADEVITDDYRVEPLGVRRDATRDTAARTGDVHAAVLAASDGSITVTLRQGSQPPPAALVLRLAHATRASEDRAVQLAASGGQSFKGSMPPLGTGHWYVELAPPDGTWRLTGEFHAPLNELSLDPRPGP